ncbi:MAG: HD domain-containing phosphohydrolase [Bacillota bacterium]
MENLLGLIVCNNFSQEVSSVLESQEFSNVKILTFPGRCGPSQLNWDILKGIIDTEQKKYSKMVLLCGECGCGIDIPPKELQNCQISSMEQCFYMFLDRQIVNRYVAEGAYLFTQGWLYQWKDYLDRPTFNKKSAREFFAQLASKLVLLDTRIDNNSSLKYMQEFAEFINIPYERVPIGLDFLRLYLKQIVLEWQLEQSRTNVNRQYAEAEQTLFTERERLAVTLHSIADGVIATDIEGKIVLINQVAQEFTGWEHEDVIGKHIAEVFNIVDENTRNSCENPIEKVLESRLVVGLSNHAVLIARDGTERGISDNAAPIRDNEGNIIGVVLVFRDVTNERVAEGQIKYLSFHDKMTGLYNRAYFESEMQRLDTERQLPLSIILGDVNGLKLVNDAFGHQEGDRLLMDIASILQVVFRKEDIIARYGGDEFAVILPRTPQESALEICERIRMTCQNFAANHVQPNLALGIATKEYATQNIQLLLKDAEDRMYRNKLVERKSNRSSIIASLQKTLEERTHDTEEHAMRLQNLALVMGHKLGLSDSQMDELSLLSVLHDIGKIAIPDAILNKPDKLTPTEWETMKKHSEIGYRIALATVELGHIADAILSHHERWDGTGYPQGLKGNDIPLISRILAIIDSFDVLTHERPYKKASSRKEALDEIERCAGSQYDPKLLEIFMWMMPKESTMHLD